MHCTFQKAIVHAHTIWVVYKPAQEPITERDIYSILNRPEPITFHLEYYQMHWQYVVYKY